jgi:hypothetical protein
MLYLCLFLSALLLVVVNAVALRRNDPRVGLAALVSVAAAVPLLATGFLLPTGNALLVALAGAVCWALKARPRWFLISSLAVTAAAYGIVGGTVGVRELREWEQAKKTYPMTSLEPRLAYENRPRHKPDGNPYDPARLSALEARFERQEEKFERTRARSLEILHAGTLAQFVNDECFGPILMDNRPSPEYLLVNDALLDLTYLSSHRQASGPYPPESEPGPVRVSSAPATEESHEKNVVSFLEPSDFGYVRDREHVAGFRPHQFLLYPVAPKGWRVQRIELVSLLRYDEPAVYLTEDLPSMGELRDNATTRPLDAFESEALAGLRRGEDLMAQDRPDHARVLGAIRAVKQCLPCHHAERGELLGAFSYRLVREP